MRRGSEWLPTTGRLAAVSAWLLMAGLSGQAAAATWQVPTFLVIKEDPFAQNAPNGIPDGTGAPLPQPVTPVPPAFLDSATTQMMDEIGAIFQQVGFSEPKSLRAFGGKRIVWKFDFPGGAPLGDPAKGDVGEYVRAECDLQRRFKEKHDWLALHNTQGPELYFTAAHEVFHPIQEEYEYSRSGSGGARCLGTWLDWIDEGTAEAVGSFLVEWKHGSSWAKQDEDLGFFGLRPYDASLHKNTSWTEKHVKSRVELDQIPYYTSSFWRFLMERFLDESTPRLDPVRLRALSEEFMAKEPPSGQKWIDWVAQHTALYWGPFHEVYTEFVAEFAAWPGSKYVQLKLDPWLKSGFDGCKTVSLKPGPPPSNESGKAEFRQTTKPHPIPGNPDLVVPALNEVAARCIQVTLEGFQENKVLLQAEVEMDSEDLADQLMLGFAREDRQDVLYDDCYTDIRRDRKIGPEEFRCLFYGKVQEGTTKKKGKKWYRTWRFEPQDLKGATMKTTFVLANVRPGAKPSETVAIPNLDVKFSIRRATKTKGKGTSLDIPEPRTLDFVPDPTIDRRHALYGIKKKGSIPMPPNPMNMGTIEVAALDGSGNELGKYSLMAMEPVPFEQTGPIKAVVMWQGSDDPKSIIGNQLCAGAENRTAANIERSDDEMLHIKIDTPLCKMDPMNPMQCQNGCPVVDHLTADLSLAFGWRHFAENSVEDLLTPGVLADIDRYHHEVFGEPLGGGGDSPGGGGGGGGDGESGDGGGGSSDGGTVVDECLCTCEEYEEIQRRAQELKDSGSRDMSQFQRLMTCSMQCAMAYKDCPRP